MTVSPTEKRGAEVATFDPSTSAFPALFEMSGGGLEQVVRDNFGDEGFNPANLTRLHVQPGGVTRWMDDEDEEVDAIAGVVILWNTTRAWWEKSRDEAGDETTPPDCASADGKVGIGAYGPNSTGNPSGACADCPMNAWESGKGKSKACKEQRQVWVLKEGAILPVRVSLPPTSIGPWTKYMTRLAGDGKSYMAVITELTLDRKKMGGNQVAVAKPRKVRELDPVEAEAARQYGFMIEGLLASAIRAEVEGQVVQPSGSGSSAAAPAGGDPNDPWAGEGDLGAPPADLQD